jgi:hypothetical protein
MVTLTICTPKEPDLTFISRPKLPEPPECFSIPTIGTFYSNGGQGADRFGIIDDNYLFLLSFIGDLHLCLTMTFFFPAAGGTDERACLIF